MSQTEELKKLHFVKVLCKAEFRNDCVEFSGTLMPNGYGKLGHNKKTYLAHRFAWEATYGAISDGMHVLHKCDNRKCINPEHLFLGTRKDNMQDMITKRTGKVCWLVLKELGPAKTKQRRDER